MTLQDLIDCVTHRPHTSVPDWMLGYYKRRSISFANGTTDLKTHVCWFQSRNFTIDLRLPVEERQMPFKPLNELSASELQVLADFEGWEALCQWDGEALSWHTDTSLQINNRWPEPAILKRIGNCMIEFAPSGAYVEDWRLQPSRPGPLIGLRMIEERDLENDVVRHRGGGLIVCGDYAALVLGRAEPVNEPNTATLKTLVTDALEDPTRLAHLLNFETSVGQGSLAEGFTVTLSTNPARVHRALIALDGFEFLVDSHCVSQTLTIDGVLCERLYTVDALEKDVCFDQSTGFTPAASQWFEREAQTLERYTQAFS